MEDCYYAPLPTIKKAEFKVPEDLAGRWLIRGGQETGAAWASMLTMIMPTREEATAATPAETSSRWDFEIELTS